MSSIVDESVFNHFQEAADCWDSQGLALITELSKMINPESASHLLRSSPQAHSTVNRLHFRSREYLLRLTALRTPPALEVTVSEMGMHGARPDRSGARARQAVVDLSSLQFAVRGEGSFWVCGGRVEMGVRFLLPGGQRSRPLVDNYNRLIYQSIHRLHLLLDKLPPQSTYSPHRTPTFELNEQLTILRIMHTDANFDPQELMQFRQGQTALKTQRAQLKAILKNLVLENQLERNVESLFAGSPKEAASLWVRNNLIHVSETVSLKYKNVFLLPPRSNERRIDDFVFNTVQVQVRQRMAKPIAEGGSSLIFLVRAGLTFVSSQDFTHYRKASAEEKVEKLLAVKVLKAELEERLRGKMEHEQRVVARMHGSCTYFLPKYYGTSKEGEFTRCLLMEYLTGEPLDAFLRARAATASLRTKLYLLFNILLGLRYLVAREIVHLDLKPANIVVGKQLLPRIIDFAAAYHRDLCPKDYVPGFTLPYAAPEVVAIHEARAGRTEDATPLAFSEKQDVFALGVIMHEVFFGCPPLTLSPGRCRRVYSARAMQRLRMLAPERAWQLGEEGTMGVLLLGVGRCLEAAPEERPKVDWLGVVLKMLLNSFNRH